MFNEATLPVDGGHTGRRRHRRHETIVSVLSGVVYLLIDGDEYVLTPGDLARIPAGAEHCYWNAGDEEAHVVERLYRTPETLQRAA